jgi:hypothetical protein
LRQSVRPHAAFGAYDDCMAAAQKLLTGFFDRVQMVAYIQAGPKR